MANLINESLIIKTFLDGESGTNYQEKLAYSGLAETWTKNSSGKVVIAALGNADLAFNGIVNAKLVFIKLAKAGYFKLNGGTEEIPCFPYAILRGDAINDIDSINVVDTANDTDNTIDFLILA